MEKTLFDAIYFGLKPMANANFSDANTAAVNALREELNLDANASIRDIRACSQAAFAIIEEVLDEVLPAEMTNILGDFAEVKSFARDAEVIFHVENKGTKRARLSVTKGARGGIYKAAKLDKDLFQIDVDTYTAAVFVTLEDLILGRYTLAELFSNILRGFEEIVYKETVEALRAAKTLAPAANIKSGSGLNLADVDACIRIANAYGKATIFGFSSALSELSNKMGAAGLYPNVSGSDAEDYRTIGHVSMYRGTKVVELPNYLMDETNTKWMFSESDIFVLPSDTKPVKVAFKGDMYIKENSQPTGSVKWEAHKMMGVGLAFANNVCVITNTDLV